MSPPGLKAGLADDADAVMNAFLAREAEGTTGMMEGFAIPHAKSDAITEAAVIVVKDDSGVTGWDTMDGAPVNVAIALLIPGAQAGTTHLKILSKVAEALMDEASVPPSRVPPTPPRSPRRSTPAWSNPAVRE